MDFKYFVFSFADLDNLPLDGDQTVTVQGTPDLIRVTDDDPNLDESIEGVADTNQVVETPVVIDGVTKDVSFSKIGGEGKYDVLNTTTGQSGTLVVVALLDNGGTRDFIGFTSTIPLNVGDVLEVALIDASNEGVPHSSMVACFGRGTMIETAQGARNLEDLKTGDLVWTLDGEFQPIRWTGSTKYNVTDLIGNDTKWPVRISAGALGPDMPVRDLIVSPQHRLLIHSKIAERMTGDQEILSAAKHLVAAPGIEISPPSEEVEYWHILLDDHHILRADGALAESLFTGPQALKTLSEQSRNEVLAIAKDKPSQTLVRQTPKSKKIRKLVERHAKNKLPLCTLSLTGTKSRTHKEAYQGNKGHCRATLVP